jgi:hypothetical protein
MADCLVQVLDELNGFCYRAAGHDPKSEIDFQRDMHRARPCLIFEDSKQLTLFHDRQNLHRVDRKRDPYFHGAKPLFLNSVDRPIHIDA